MADSYLGRAQKSENVLISANSNVKVGRLGENFYRT